MEGGEKIMSDNKFDPAIALAQLQGVIDALAYWHKGDAPDRARMIEEMASRVIEESAEIDAAKAANRATNT